MTTAPPPISTKPTLTNYQLSQPRREFFEFMQQLQFGRLEQLVVQHGQPVLTPRPRITREFKFGAQRVDRSNLRTRNFTLNSQHLDFLALLDDLGNGVIAVLEVQNGLPFRASVTDATT